MLEVLSGTTIRYVQLLFSEGTADKEYVVFCTRDSNATYRVDAYYGRRGSATKHAPQGADLTLEAAQTLFVKTVSSKTRKGYRIATDSSNDDEAVVGPALIERNDTGLRPQLLNQIDESAAQTLIADPAFCLQPKYDGQRLLVRVTRDSIITANRSGNAVACPVWLEKGLLPTNRRFVIDGELVGEEQRFYVFDLFEMNDDNLRSRPYAQRLSLLESLAGGEDWGDNVRVVETFRTSQEKQDACNALQRTHAEGVVFKDVTAPVTIGRPNTGGTQYKWKFYETTTARVSAVNTQRSVALVMFDHGQPVAAGNVTVKANQQMPAIGTYVEVRYLYVTAPPPAGRLYQPVLLNIRTDVSDTDCEIATLKLRPNGT